MMKSFSAFAPLFCCLSLAACVGQPESASEDEAVESAAPTAHHAVNGANASASSSAVAIDNEVNDHGGASASASSSAVATGNGISYHGGAVMTAGANVYLIWYGNWSGNSATTILTDLASNIGGSSWFDINTTYGSSSSNVANAVTYAGSTTDAYSQGTTLSDASVKSVVSRAISNGALPADANGVYFVLTSSDVAESSGFCSSYCGWHTHATISGVDVKYSFVGNADRCLAACAAQTSSPNGNAGADAMASVFAHELSESVTDPDLNAWYDSSGYENADKCAWTFGATYHPSGSATANVRIGSRDYLLQQNWVNAGGGYCAKSYGSCGTLGSGQSLSTSQSVTSCDGRFTLVMQGDGNLVLYWNGHSALWATNTAGTTGQTAAMQGDGNFVLYNSSGHALWASNTNGHSGATLSVQNDGNVVVYQNGIALWATNTSGH